MEPGDIDTELEQEQVVVQRVYEWFHFPCLAFCAASFFVRDRLLFWSAFILMIGTLLSKQKRASRSQNLSIFGMVFICFLNVYVMNESKAASDPEAILPSDQSNGQ